jgi:hypothetical protein
MKNALAVVATLALALAGCSETGSTTTETSNQTSPVSSLQMNLTLPDGTVINTVNYSVTGGPSSVTRSGVVNVENSTQLRFRVGNLPVGPGYTMALGGTTVSGSACAGSAGFDIADNQVTTLTMTLVCGTGVVYEIDGNGDVAVTVEVTNEAGVTCPVVTGISALPLEVLVGFSLQLEGYATSTTDVTYAWSGAGGTFSAGTAAATAYLCQAAGDNALTFTIAKPGCDPSSIPVTVTCTGTGDAGEPDAAEPDAAEPDAAEPDAGEPDAAEPDAGQPDAAEPDAAEPDAAEPDAGNDAGPTPDTCSACLSAAASPCRDYQGSGFDLYANCIENPDPAFAQRCVDAYECSVQSTDLCAGDLTRGPVSCYCGIESVRTIDQCFAAPSATTGPAGACIPQWEAATGCPAGDNACVSNLFVDLSLPSGGANYLVTCAVTECASACALPRPVN